MGDAGCQQTTKPDPKSPMTPVFMSERRKNKTFSSFSVGSAFKSLRIKKQTPNPPVDPIQNFCIAPSVKKKGFFRSGLDVLFHSNSVPVPKSGDKNFRKTRSYHHINANQISPLSPKLLPKANGQQNDDHYYCKGLQLNGLEDGSGRRSAEPRINFWVNRKASICTATDECERKWKVCGNKDTLLNSLTNNTSNHHIKVIAPPNDNENFDSSLERGPDFDFGDHERRQCEKVDKIDKSAFTDGLSNCDDNCQSEDRLDLTSPNNTTQSLTIKERLQLKELLEKLGSQDINTDSFNENSNGPSNSPSNTLPSFTGIRTNGSLPRDQKIPPHNQWCYAPSISADNDINHDCSESQYGKITRNPAQDNLATKSFTILGTSCPEKTNGLGPDCSDSETNVGHIPDVLKSMECAKFLDRIVGERGKIGNNIKSLTKYLQDVQQQHQEITEKMSEERQAIELELKEQIENVFKEQQEIQEYQKVCREYLESLESQRDEKRKILNKLQENINKDEKYVKNYIDPPESSRLSDTEDDNHTNGHEGENGHHILQESFESDVKAYEELEFQILEIDSRIEEEKERAINKIDSHKERFLQKFQYTQERINVIDPSKLEILNKYAVSVKQLIALENQLEDVLKLEQTKFKRLDTVINTLTNTGGELTPPEAYQKSNYSCSQIPTPINSDIASQPTSPNQENRDELLRKRASEEIKTFWREYLCNSVSNKDISHDTIDPLNTNFHHSTRPKANNYWNFNDFKTTNFSKNGLHNGYRSDNFSDRRSSSFRCKERTDENALDLSCLNVNQRLTDIFNQKLKILDEELLHLQKVEKIKESKGRHYTQAISVSPFTSTQHNEQHLVNFNSVCLSPGSVSPLTSPTTTQSYTNHTSHNPFSNANCDNFYSKVSAKSHPHSNGVIVDDSFSFSTPSPNSYYARDGRFNRPTLEHRPSDIYRTYRKSEDEKCESKIIYDSANPGKPETNGLHENNAILYGPSASNQPALIYSTYTSSGPFANYDLRTYLNQSAGHNMDMHDKYLCVTKMGARGYLQKLGMKFKIWKKRWFIFDKMKRNITYYDDKSEGKVKGVIYFQAIEEVYVDHMSSFKAPISDASFCLKTFDKLYYLTAPNPDVMRIWVDILLTAAEGQTIYKNYDNN